MKFSEHWLRTFVDPPLSARELADALAMGGLDVESLEPGPDGDSLITVKPTPNRGDCLSLTGIAREVAAITRAPLTEIGVEAVSGSHDDALPVRLAAPRGCPRYCGRLLRGVNANAVTPAWMVARLTRSGLRPISAIVDITNYVMLELGQPLHAFDAERLAGGICVRFAQDGETLLLLNGESPKLAADFLVIADERRALALAGIMGGAESAVTATTTNVFLESAFFEPQVIAGKTRRLGFGSDSAYRFERGVDFAGTQRALERATRLILDVCGGAAGPVSEACEGLPQRAPVNLRRERAERVLGIGLDRESIPEIFRRLRFTCVPSGAGFTVTPPSYRFDIAIEEDLIEEVARIHGYENIPAAAPRAPVVMLPAPEATRDVAAVRQLLAARDYQEVVTYSFVERRWEEDFCANLHPVTLANPIASHLSVMRSSLIGSLVNCVAFNVSRQQLRVRAFEVARCFDGSDGATAQPMRVAGIAYGSLAPRQWDGTRRNADFHDVKSDVEALLGSEPARFEAAPHPAFHPGRTARVMRAGQAIGWIGELHPRWQRKYELPLAPVVFELDLAAVLQASIPAATEIPRFPAVRRDLSAEFDADMTHDLILAGLWAEAPVTVRDIAVFDLFRGGPLGKGKKSLAFRVLLQDTEKTLTDGDVDSAVSKLRHVLQQRFSAKLR